jgi:methionyl-tRNA formyltransferase
VPQPAEGASYAAKIKKEDGRIDWRLPAKTIWNRLRAFTPWPGAFTFRQDAASPQMLKIWKAEVVDKSGPAGELLTSDKNGITIGCGHGSLRIIELQREGGKRLPADQFLAGFPLKPRDTFS